MIPSLAFALALLAPSADPPAKNPFEFADGDRVVFLGGTLIEREQKYGSWELALTLLNKGKSVSFRNLGWSGDTVWCESRGSFDGPKKGFDNTIALLKELKPTVIILCYGHVESFDGPDGVKKFADGLNKLIDGVNVTKARVVLMTPTPFEDVKPVTDADKKNGNLRQYVTAMKEIAEKRKLEFRPLFDLPLKGERLDDTENGIHLSADGYQRTAWYVSGYPLDRFEGETRVMAESLRTQIVAKNELIFHRWRPQNQTYLLGFRKHEQGQNAKEIVEFDPLVDKAEKQIEELVKAIK